ncbi:class I SAM-dependent methyltransferase [Flagellimonas sp. S3867]|uniref:class I SAM-dependent methyltransferase n=1 Tax=Flagellimonas sp. S3867 TaxID=2768063 RepID=UPI0016872773|nr:class I SAM-dependent methyltransferase [Flagellimonas sp. S3867]
MNKLILNTGVQDFINNNWNADIMSVLLKKQLFEGISQKELAEQLEAKKKCKDKLPTWFNTEGIYFPNKRNIEQTSSERTAAYKARLIGGKTLLDVTGGFGVDTYFFSKEIRNLFHCEINPELSEIAKYNFEVLGQKNISCFSEDGIELLKKSNQKFDWVYIDPSRRSGSKGKVFLLKDCIPNLPEYLPSIFEKTTNILVKTSPLLDISQGIKELDFVKEVHVVALHNDVKELLFVLAYGFDGDIAIKTVNLVKGYEEVFDFKLQEEQETTSTLGAPETYLYEPNSPILKSGGFKSVANTFGLKKLHQHSHLYTSTDWVDFPGRRFEIIKTIPYSKRNIKDLGITKANVTSRNFPIPVAELRKKHKIKDGGESYLFFTTDVNDKLMVLLCKKLNPGTPI